MNKVDSTTDSIGQRIHEAGDRIGDFKDHVKNDVDRRVKSLGATMKEHPFIAVAAGIGIGYLIARITHR